MVPKCTTRKEGDQEEAPHAGLGKDGGCQGSGTGSVLKGRFFCVLSVVSTREEEGCWRLLPRSGYGDGRPLLGSSSATFMLSGRHEVASLSLVSSPMKWQIHKLLPPEIDKSLYIVCEVFIGC